MERERGRPAAIRGGAECQPRATAHLPAMTSGTNSDIRNWLHGDCQEFQRSWLKRWNARNAQPPPCLYHYTKADGARGIVTSQTIWGTDARYLNDTSELSYVNTVVAQVANQLLEQYSQDLPRTFLEAASMLGFRVIDVPGHSRGHIALFREADRVLILGDLLNSADPLTGVRGLRLPKDFFTPDPQRNRESARRLGELEPSIVAFGHGPPVRDTKKFLAFCRAL
jgi:hypothetical protein